MKPRRVVVTLELTTILSVAKLRTRALWQEKFPTLGPRTAVKVEQVQANAIRSGRPRGAKRRR